MHKSSKSTAPSARRVGPKPPVASPQPCQPSTHKEIIDFLEQRVRKACPDLPDLHRSHLSEQLAVLKKGLTQPSEKQPAQRSLEIITTPAQLDQLVAAIQSEKEVVIALATSGNNHRTDTLVGIAISAGDKDYYLPLGHRFPGGQLLPDQLSPSLLTNKLSLSGPGLITYDAKKMLHFLRHHAGISVHFSYDIMVASKLLAAHEDADLDSMIHRHPSKSASEEAGLSLKSPQLQSIEAVAKIMADRCHSFLEIYRQQAGMYLNAFLMNEVELPLIAVVADLEDNGYQIDSQFLEALLDPFLAEQSRLLDKIRLVAGSTFNPDDAGQVAALVYDKLCLPVHDYTNSGRRSVKSEALLPFVKTHPILADLLDCRAANRSLLITCNILEVAEKDGRYRVTFDQLGTVSGRFCSNSIIQTVPKVDSNGIRRGFAARPGCLLVATDIDQQDIRVLAAVSGDPCLQAAITEGIDLHGLIAKVLFNLPCTTGEVKELYPAERQKAKTFQYALIYGATPLGIAQAIDIEVERAASLVANYFHQFPGVKAFIDDAHSKLLREGYLDDVFGRRRWFPEVRTTSDSSVREHAMRAGQNHVVQAASATITKMAMVRCHQHITANYPDIKMVLTLHDELHFEVPIDLVDTFARELPDLMCNLGLERFGFQEPLKVEVKVGPNWADLKPYVGGNA